jgi:hypothetical protein
MRVDAGAQVLARPSHANLVEVGRHPAHQAVDKIEGRVGGAAEEHRFAPAVEVDVDEPGVAQQRVDAVGVGEGERPGSADRGYRQRAAGGHGRRERTEPFVAIRRLPVSSASRPPGRTARAMLPNAASGSPKNLAPARLIATS